MATKEGLERTRRLLKRDYNRIIDEINKITKVQLTIDVVEQLETLKSSIATVRDKLDEMYYNYLELLDLEQPADVKLDDELVKERDTHLLHIDRAISICNTSRRKLEGNTRRESLNTTFMGDTPNQSSAKLPKINVPTFNGDVRKFLDFKALYENLVHNDDNIPTVRKMHYLKESLVGEAATTLANLSVSEEGYREAWSRVTSKYDNKRLIIHSHFNDLFTTEKLKNESGLRLLVDRFDSAIRGFKICSIMPDSWSPILAYMLYTRLDIRTRTDFDNQVVDNSSYIQFKQLFKFCETRASNIEARKFEELPSTTVVKPATAPKPTESKRSFLTAKGSCIACKEQHLLIDCPAFKTRTPQERLQLVRANKMCVNCFSRAHNTAACTSPKRCKTCSKLHHTMLHLNVDPAKPLPTPALENNPPVPASSAATSEPKFSSNVSTQSIRKFIVLPSALVRFECGSTVGAVRVLIDDCSQPTLVSDDFVRRFKLPAIKSRNADPIHGVGFDNIDTSHLCSIKLASRISTFEMNIEAEVIPAAALRYAVNSISWSSAPKQFSRIKQYQLADPAFYQDQPVIDKIDILLGAEFSELCKINETVRIDELTLRNTHFGWTLVGKFPSQPTAERVCCLTTQPSSHEVNDQLTRFWELEDIPFASSNTVEAEHCERHFVQTTTKNEQNQFVVRLPFKTSPTVLKPNCTSATALFLNAERRRNPDARESYIQFMEEYEKLGHMSKVPRSNRGYFIPHHPVLKPSSTTTKFRVVFNASFKTASNYSLNDVLMVGPQLQPDLFSALIRFRSYIIVFTADISKMYRCIWVHPDDRKFQKILWRPNPEMQLAEYELNTLTYGTAPASYIATRCLKAVAESVANTQPAAAHAIESHFYMDDLLTGSNSIQEAKALCEAIHSNLKAVGFELRKYQSNSSEILSNISPELVETSSSYEFGDTWAISILGLFWEPTTDTLRLRSIQKDLATLQSITKRRLLSEISKIFDPLGLASPFTIRAKIFLQKVWREGIQWDQCVSESLASEVQVYFAEMNDLTKFAMPRPYCSTVPESKYLIGFSDASDKAYCAAIYLRSVNSDSIITTRLVCAKTRVAPVKALTIPRLELQGALLVSELARRVASILHIANDDVYLFSDSEVVLAWLAKPDAQWDVFVKNRVQKITAMFPYYHWSYVGTKDNPADLGTRGVTAKSLANSELWSFGPPFLNTFNFSRVSGSRYDFQTTEEASCSTQVTYQVSKIVQCPLIARFSKYNRLIAVIGRVIYWVRKWRLTRPPKDKYSNTSISECISFARTAVIRLLQSYAYESELAALRQSECISSKSSLRHLDPFIDEDGVIRVTGRLQNSNVSYAKKHPIVLPKNCHFLSLYVDYVHSKFCHANKDFVLRFVLAEFYPVGGLAKLVKSRLRKCLACAKIRAETYGQIMGQLPAARVTISRPFSHTGVDFCGPFSCKCLNHRSTKYTKIYACIFICMVTRAVHIKVASDLSATVFLMALHRFIARRGLPAMLYSDQGTNFVGANNYLNFDDEEIQRFTGAERIKWVFNPPRTPHRGGLWEAAVKAAKAHLKRVILDQPLNFEEYSTIFSRIEAVLNSRPLCYRRSSSSAEDFVLTPSHFLIGDSSYTLPEPEPDACQSKLPLLARYNFVRSILNGFWKLWRSDYLNMLQRKEKWCDREENIELNQIVLVKLPTPPNEWPLARVEALHADPEGQVRTVTVNYKGKLRCIDIRSLVKLPVENEQ